MGGDLGKTIDGKTDFNPIIQDLQVARDSLSKGRKVKNPFIGGSKHNLLTSKRGKIVSRSSSSIIIERGSFDPGYYYEIYNFGEKEAKPFINSKNSKLLSMQPVGKKKRSSPQHLREWRYTSRCEFIWIGDSPNNVLVYEIQQINFPKFKRRWSYEVYSSESGKKVADIHHSKKMDRHDIKSLGGAFFVFTFQRYGTPGSDLHPWEPPTLEFVDVLNPKRRFHVEFDGTVKTVKTFPISEEMCGVFVLKYDGTRTIGTVDFKKRSFREVVEMTDFHDPSSYTKDVIVVNQKNRKVLFNHGINVHIYDLDTLQVVSKRTYDNYRVRGSLEIIEVEGNDELFLVKLRNGLLYIESFKDSGGKEHHQEKPFELRNQYSFHHACYNYLFLTDNFAPPVLIDDKEFDTKKLTVVELREGGIIYRSENSFLKRCFENVFLTNDSQYLLYCPKNVIRGGLINKVQNDLLGGLADALAGTGGHVTETLPPDHRFISLRMFDFNQFEEFDDSCFLKWKWNRFSIEDVLPFSKDLCLVCGKQGKEDIIYVVKLNVFREFRFFVLMCWTELGLPVDIYRHALCPFLSRSLGMENFKKWRRTLKSGEFSYY